MREIHYSAVLFLIAWTALGSPQESDPSRSASSGKVADATPPGALVATGGELTLRRSVRTPAFPGRLWPPAIVIAPDGWLAWAQETDRQQQQGELRTFHIGDAAAKTFLIPQPQGFVPKRGRGHGLYFTYPKIWRSPTGTLLVAWQLEGNGDHGVALFDPVTESFVVARTKHEGVTLTYSGLALAAEDGRWYLVYWKRSAWKFDDSRITVLALDKHLKRRSVGIKRGFSDHSGATVDAVLVGNIMHFVWAEVKNRKNNRLRILTANLDVESGVWSDERTIFSHKAFTSRCSPVVRRSADGSLHYLWSLDARRSRRSGNTAGFYYQSPAGKTTRLTDDDRFTDEAKTWHLLAAAALGDGVALCTAEAHLIQGLVCHTLRAGFSGQPTTLAMTSRVPFEKLLLAPAEGRRLWLHDYTSGMLTELELR